MILAAALSLDSLFTSIPKGSRQISSIDRLDDLPMCLIAAFGS